MASLSPPDGLGYCECERCRAVAQGGKTFQKHGTTFATRPDGVEVSITSETLFGFVNQVATAVAAKFLARVTVVDHAIATRWEG